MFKKLVGWEVGVHVLNTIQSADPEGMKVLYSEDIYAACLLTFMLHVRL